MVRIEINPKLLRWALDRAPDPESIHRKFPKLNDWLEQKGQPTLRQLEEFSKATRTPFGYFFLSKPPEEQLPIPLFRTLTGEAARRPSPDLLDVVQTMQRRQAWMRAYLIEKGAEPLPFVESAQLSDPPRLVAQEMRHTLRLNTGWADKQPTWTAALRQLQRNAEDVGIIVVASAIVGNNTRRTLDPEEFRGFVLVDGYAPLVFINASDGKAAQMFTLAHELAHIWLGRSAAFDLRDLQPAADGVEQACNRIAAEFLVPAEELANVWQDAKQRMDRFQVLARRFKVSELVVARRALDLELITKQEFFDFYQNRQQEPSRGREGGNFYATQMLRLGRPFAEMVWHAVQDGALLYHEAYRLTGLHGRAFDRFVKYLSKGIR